MDTIGDMLTSVMNAQRAQKRRVAVPYSTFKKDLLEFFKEKGFVGSVRVQEAPKAKLVVTLQYDDNNQPALQGVKRLSKPGSRYYVGSEKIPFRYANMGMIIVSTSKGLMSDREARKQGLGGELICALW